MKSKQQSGIILVMSLLISLIISLLVLANLRNLNTALQIVNRQQQQRQLLYTSEATLQNIIKKFKPNARQACIRTANSVNYYPQALLKNSIDSCDVTINHMRLKYIIEAIDQIPCVMIGTDQHAAAFYRINLLGQADTIHVLLQVVFATFATTPPKTCDQHTIQMITLGKQSWRLI